MFASQLSITGDFPYLRMAVRSAFPLLISLSLLSVISLVDIFLAGTIGEDAQAAMGIAEQVVFLNMIMLTGLCAGMNAKIAQAWGAGNLREAGDFARHGMCVAVIFGLVATIFGVVSADMLAGAFSANLSVRHQAAEYIRLCAFANLWWAAIMCQTTIFRAVGKAQWGTFEWLIITVFCVGLEVFCFYGLSGCRALVSLAVSWNLAAPLGVVYGVAKMKNVFLKENYSGAGWKRALPGCGGSASERIETEKSICYSGAGLEAGAPGGGASASERIETEKSKCCSGAGWKPALMEDLGSTLFARNARCILAIAVPVMVGEMCWLVSNLVLYVLLAAVPSATTAQAAWTITLRIEETLAYVPLTAISLATATSVGHAIGGGREFEARRIVRSVAVGTSIFMLMAGAVVWLCSPYMASLFSRDMAVQRLTVRLLSASIVTFPVNALTLILSSALEGRGLTMRPMIANVTGLLAVRLPAAWALAVPLAGGVIGIWLARILSNVVTAVLMLAAFSIGDRKNIPDAQASQNTRPIYDRNNLPGSYLYE